MTREEKVKKKKERAIRRILKKKRQLDELKSFLYWNSCGDIPFSVVRRKSKHGYWTDWEDSNSPTGRSQFCDYYGTCQSPCNGDC